MPDLASKLKGKSKAEMRQMLRDYRDRLSPEEVAKKSDRVFKRLFSLPVFIEANTVLFYMSYRNELDTRKIIQRSIQISKNICLPRMVVDTSDLDVYEINNIEKDTAPGILGITEPRLDAKKCEDLRKIDLCIVPAIAFDRRGHRIGWGKGFYDRFLPKLPASTKKFGIAYDFQVLERIKSHDRDVPLDGLITEDEVIYFDHFYNNE